jgi:hypothetical protein
MDDVEPLMKITLDIEDGLFARAQRLAAQRGITVDALVEEELQHALAAHPEPVPERAPSAARAPFVLLTFGEGGLTPEAEAKGLNRVILDTYDQAYTAR